MNRFMHSTKVPIPYSEWYSLSYKDPQTAKGKAEQNENNAKAEEHRKQEIKIDASHTIRYYIKKPRTNNKYFAFQFKNPKEPIRLQ